MAEFIETYIIVQIVCYVQLLCVLFVSVKVSDLHKWIFLLTFLLCLVMLCAFTISKPLATHNYVEKLSVIGATCSNGYAIIPPKREGIITD